MENDQNDGDGSCQDVNLGCRKRKRQEICDSSSYRKGKKTKKQAEVDQVSHAGISELFCLGYASALIRQTR